MANQITGKIYKISPTETINSKDGSKSFQKREIILDCTRFDPYTGEPGFSNFPALEFSGEKCAELDNFTAGQIATVSFDLQGMMYEKDGVQKNMTRVRAYKIELKKPVQATNPAPTASANNAPTNPANPTPPAPAAKNDDLPF